MDGHVHVTFAHIYKRVKLGATLYGNYMYIRKILCSYLLFIERVFTIKFCMSVYAFYSVVATCSLLHVN